MRLLDARTYRLHTELGQKKPCYAILSHTWEIDEVLFEDINSAPDTSGKGKKGVFKGAQVEPHARWKEKKGFFKIKQTCEQALKDGYDFVWVDTCCINKESSAELSEAINSMFMWYQEASICYTYLSDAVRGDKPSIAHRWFGRGWTLQELIAPDHVHFYDKDWTYMGSRISLSSDISEVTGIPKALLTRHHKDQKPPPTDHDYSSSYRCRHCSVMLPQTTRAMLSGLSVSQRMKWASTRTTTRIEDTAYCLMGLFDVNMPLLYGEGLKAFYRLQAEIIKETNDHTILAFRATSDIAGGERYWPILAPHPRSFKHHDCQNEWLPNLESAGMSMSGGTLSVNMFICPLKQFQGLYIGILDCMVDNDYLSRPALVLDAKNESINEFWRCSSLAVLRYSDNSKPPYCTVSSVGGESRSEYEYDPKDIKRTRITIISENVADEQVRSFGLPVRLNVSSTILDTHLEYFASPELVARFLPSVVTNGAIGIISFHSETFEDFFVGWRGSVQDRVEHLRCRIWTAEEIVRENQEEFYPGWPGVHSSFATTELARESLHAFAFDYDPRDVQRVILRDSDETTLGKDRHTIIKVHVSVSKISFIGRTVFQLNVNGDASLNPHYHFSGVPIGSYIQR